MSISNSFNSENTINSISEKIVDIEDLCKKQNHSNYTPFITELASKTFNTNADIDREIKLLQKKYHTNPNKATMTNIYNHLIENNTIKPNEDLRKYIKGKQMRGHSGVIVISTITSPYPKYIEDGKEKTQRFSCKHDCFYCPRELDKNGREVNARSYLSDEPTVARGLQYNYDPILQFNARAEQYITNGHYVDKIECIVLGGTWTEYPRQYQETYIRDLFYAANTLYEKEERQKLSLAEEKKLNQNELSQKTYELVSKILSQFEPYINIDLSKEMKNQIMTIFKDIRKFSKNFNWYSNINENLKLIKKYYD